MWNNPARLTNFRSFRQARRGRTRALGGGSRFSDSRHWNNRESTPKLLRSNTEKSQFSEIHLYILKFVDT